MNIANPRFNQLLHWLQQPERRLSVAIDSLKPASSDASFRHYFRANRLEQPEQSVIIMDAPPEKENNTAFIDHQKRLAQAGLKVPEIYDADLDLGFLMLSDLGQHNLYGALTNGLDPMATHSMYRIVLNELVQMQKTNTTGLPKYTAERMLEELTLFYDYYLKQHCKIILNQEQRNILDHIFQELVKDNCQYPYVYVHRDFHSPNIMMPTDKTLKPGLIDFQDAILGPITYDIASLVMDARYSWNEEQQIDWAVRYWEKARQAGLPVCEHFVDFHRAYEWMSIQRNLRILGVFCRLSIRDNKHHYMEHIPRVQKYLRQVIQRYEFFNPLRALLDKIENKQTVLGITF